MSNEFNEEILQFHGKECCWFSYKGSRQGLEFILKKLKDYKEVEATWVMDRGEHSLWQCPNCGAYFLMVEDEHTVWGPDGDDWGYTVRNWCQVDSPEHADKLMSVEGLFEKYEGPSLNV